MKFGKLPNYDWKMNIFPLSLLTGLFSILYLHRGDIRHDLLPLRPCPLAVLRREYLRVGAVCMAHRYDSSYQIECVNMMDDGVLIPY